MFIKKAMATVLALAISLNLAFPVHASIDKPYRSISFASEGNKLIFSNGPEAINETDVAHGGAYTISQALTPNTLYDVEFYHHNKTTTDTKLKIGVVICNISKTDTGYITCYANNSVGHDTWGGSANIQLCAQNQVNFWQAHNSPKMPVGNISIAPQENKFICFAEDVGYDEFANGKCLIKPTSRNLYCKVVFVTSTYKNPIYNLPKSRIDGHTTGTFDYDTRTATFNYVPNSTNAFYLNNTTDINTGEYASNVGCYGNYGVNYKLTLKGAAGKYLYITPDSAAGSRLQYYTTYTVNDGWRVSDPYLYGYVRIQIPSNELFRFTLPGGATGNVYFQIQDR